VVVLPNVNNPAGGLLSARGGPTDQGTEKQNFGVTIINPQLEASPGAPEKGFTDHGRSFVGSHAYFQPRPVVRPANESGDEKRK
jgi:hypothetical protein